MRTLLIVLALGGSACVRVAAAQGAPRGLDAGHAREAAADVPSDTAPSDAADGATRGILGLLANHSNSGSELERLLREGSRPTPWCLSPVAAQSRAPRTLGAGFEGLGRDPHARPSRPRRPRLQVPPDCPSAVTYDQPVRGDQGPQLYEPTAPIDVTATNRTRRRSHQPVCCYDVPFSTASPLE